MQAIGLLLLLGGVIGYWQSTSPWAAVASILAAMAGLALHFGGRLLAWWFHG